MSDVYQDTGEFVRTELSADKKRLTLIFKPVDGKLRGKEVIRSNFVSALDSKTISTVKELKAGDHVTIGITLNKKGDITYRNFVSVEPGLSETKTTATKTSDYNDRAAKGQALNLAMQIAIAEGRQHDTDYILSLIPAMISLGETVQGDKIPKTTATTTKTAGTTATKFKKKEEPNPWDDLDDDVDLSDLAEL